MKNTKKYRKPTLEKHGAFASIIRSGTGLFRDDWFIRQQIPPNIRS